MRKLWNDKKADMNMIMAALIMAIVFAVGIIIIFNIMVAIDVSSADDTLAGNMLDHPDWNTSTTNYGTNATNDLLGNIGTFFTVGPIALIVVAAVGILSYVLLLRRT